MRHRPISRICQASAAEWQSHWDACEHATFFEGPEWAELWQDYTRGALRPAPQRVEFDDGAAAILPFSESEAGRGWVRTCYASPAGTFGGWISQEPLTAAHGRALSDHLARGPADLRWVVSPYTPGITPPPDAREAGCTWALPIGPDFDSALRRWRPAARRALRRARERGVEVRLAQGLDDWRAYYAAYEDSLRRWGASVSSRYDWRLFEALERRASPRVRLWLAWRGGEVAAGALCLYARCHVAYWHGASRERHYAARPVQLLFHDAIRHACEAGFRWFDFNPSGGHAGVDRLKRGFGAEALAISRVERVSLRRRVLEHLVGLRETARRAGRSPLQPAAAGARGQEA